MPETAESPGVAWHNRCSCLLGASLNTALVRRLLCLIDSQYRKQSYLLLGVNVALVWHSTAAGNVVMNVRTAGCVVYCLALQRTYP